MEIEKILSPLLKWWWLILVATIIAATASYLATEQQEPIYESRTTLMVGSPIDSLNPSFGDAQLAQYLAGIYADLVKREPIQQATKMTLGIDTLPAYRANALPRSQLIEIIVTASSPELSQAVASELANQLFLQSPSSDEENQQRQEFIVNQLNLLEIQIVENRSLIEDLQAELPTLSSARQIDEIQSQIDQLSDELSSLQSSYANLLSSEPQGATNVLTLIEPAQPGYTVQPNRLIPIFLASAIGFSLAAGAAYLIEYLDKTIYTEEDVKRVLGVPVLGYIMRLKDNKNSPEYIQKNPRSLEAETFRSLRARIDNVIKDRPVKSILISSVEMSTGKSTVLTNLAISYAQAEKNITVIDADIRRPTIHNRFNLPQNPGLVEAFEAPEYVKKLLKKINGNRISVLTAGKSPTNPAELLGSKKMDRILELLMDNCDLIFLDSPPFLITDAKIIASKIDAMFLIINPGKVREDIARNIKEQIEQIGIPLLGVVFNDLSKKEMNKYGEYYYYHSYYTDD